MEANGSQAALSRSTRIFAKATNPRVTYTNGKLVIDESAEERRLRINARRRFLRSRQPPEVRERRLQAAAERRRRRLAEETPEETILRKAARREWQHYGQPQEEFQKWLEAETERVRREFAELRGKEAARQQSGSSSQNSDSNPDGPWEPVIKIESVYSIRGEMDDSSEAILPD